MSNVLFSKNDQEDQDDVWDDTALIRAYEKSVGLINKKLNEKSKSNLPSSDQKRSDLDQDMNDEEDEVDEDDEVDIDVEEDLEEEYDENETDYKGSQLEHLNLVKKKDLSEWKEGDLCMAVFTEDNLVYRAEIIEIFNETKKCIVKYLFYANEEEKLLSDLYELNEDTFKKISQAENPKPTQVFEHTSSGFSNTQPFKPPQHIPPPPPPPALATLFENKAPSELSNEEEGLYTMLMSWYMSGYHTGYYFGLKQASKK